MNNLLLEEDFIRVGFISGLSGVNGHIKAVLHSDFEDYFHKNVDFFYIRMDGMFVPYFIEECKVDKDPVLIKVEAFDSREAAVVLTDLEVYYRKDHLPEDVCNRLLSNPERWNINGFSIFLAEGEEVGKVRSIDEYPSGYMANVMDSEEREFLVPLVESFIIEIRKAEKKIIMDLPVGVVPGK